MGNSTASWNVTVAVGFLPTARFAGAPSRMTAADTARLRRWNDDRYETDGSASLWNRTLTDT